MQIQENWIFINPETYVDEEVNSVLEQILTEYSRSLELDNNLSVLSYSEREKSKKLFEKVVDQSVYFTQDHLKLRRFLIDRYSAHKSKITKARNSKDLNILTSEELNEFMVSMGFPYPRNIISRSNRIQFLSNLIKNYQKKGTSETIANIISLYGLRNVLISEWWIRYNKTREKRYYAKSNIVHPENLRSDASYETEKSYEEFIFNNPHWQITYDELDELFGKRQTLISDEKFNKISLPSITNVISIETHSNLSELELACSVFQRKIQESFDFWIGYSLIPLKEPTINPFNATIYTSMYNDPPTVEEMNADLAFNISVPYDGNNNVYLVGPNPTGVWETEGFEKKLVKYHSNTDTWTEVNPQTSGITYLLLRNDSSNYKNSLLTYNNSTQTWNIYSSFKKDVCLKARNNYIPTDSSFSPFTLVYNGEEWINLKGYIPIEKMLNRDENLFRDIPLNNFTSLYSLLEIQLVISYLNNGTSERNVKHSHFNYTGDYTPLDNGYIKDWTSKPPKRNDIDTLFYNESAYSVISEEYKNLVFDKNKLISDVDTYTFRHDTSFEPRTVQMNKRKEFYKKFTQKNKYDANLNLHPQLNPEEFLKAINLDLYNELQVQLQSETSSVILENVMVDFENYVINTMQLIESPFAYIQNGGEFLNKKLLPVLDFFKPFRVKILDFLTKFEIYNPLMDSLLVDASNVTINIEQLAVEKPLPRNLNTSDGFMYTPDSTGPPVLDYLLGHGLGTEDYFVIHIDHTINEPSFSSLDADLNYNESDISMKDAFFITVEEGGDIIFDYRTDEDLVVTDSTSGDDIEIEIVPIEE
jgi:hypothetical protein